MKPNEEFFLLAKEDLRASKCLYDKMIKTEDHEEELNFVEIRRYNDTIQSKILSPYLEKKILDLIDPNLNVKKIREERDRKTFDYVVKNTEILLEVTSMNLGLEYSTSRDIGLSSINYLFSNKLHEKILHIERKEKSPYNSFGVGGGIFLDVPHVFFLIEKETMFSLLNIQKDSEVSRTDFSRILGRLSTEFKRNLTHYVLESNFGISKIDFLIFIPYPAFTYDPISRTYAEMQTFFPPRLFLKEEVIRGRLEKTFPYLKSTCLHYRI